MQKFINFYSWGVNMKFHMGIYAVALIFFNGLARWLMGERTIPILALVEMALAAAVVAMAESWILCNLGFLGGAVVFQWFQGVPLWGMGALVLVMEAGIFAMWFATHVALKKDSKWLNYKLKQYQSQ